MNIIDAIYHIKYNPFKYGECIYFFYANLENHHDNILLLPLIIPLCTHPEYKNTLEQSNKRSSIFTIFKNKKKLYDLQERVNDLSYLSTQSLQYCFDNQWIYMKENDLNLYPNQIKDIIATDNAKIAKKLAMIFSKNSISEIYTFLGVRAQL